MKNTFIIGGNGFIGKHLIEELQLTNRKLYVVSRSKCSIDSITHIPVVSIFDESLERLLIDNADEIICLFYASKPKTSFNNPVKDIEENLAQTVRLFEIASKSSRLKKFLYISSGGTVYGNTKEEFICESHSTKPISPYGITKLAIENYAHLFNVIYNLPIVIIRPSNAYGPGQFAKDGQGFIAYAIQSILSNIPVEIYGETGTIRDYIYVQDLAKSLLAVLDMGMPGKIYNVGTQIGYSNIEIISIIQSLVSDYGYDVKVIHKLPRAFDVNRNVLDITAIKKDTCWYPTTTLKKGLLNTLNWYLKMKQV